MSGIQTNFQNQNVTVKPTVNSQKPAETKAKKGLSTPTKLVIGAAAVSATVIGEILFHNKMAIQKVINVSKVNLQRAMKRNEQLGYTEFFDNKILQGHIDEVSKLPKSEQVKKLKEMEMILTHDRALPERLKDPKFFGFEVEKLPKEVKEAITSKDQLLANGSYVKYCDNLFHKSKTAGATVEESVKNVFGANTSIKPHSYDLTKEADRIATASYTSGGGYTDVTVKSDNMLADHLNFANTVPIYRSLGSPKAFSHFISQGIAKDGRSYVQISYVQNSTQGPNNGIRLLSPHSELTPAQIDLLKLKDVENLPINDFRTLTNDPGKTNFDAILSTIQTLASKVK